MAEYTLALTGMIVNEHFNGFAGSYNRLDGSLGPTGGGYFGKDIAESVKGFLLMVVEPQRITLSNEEAERQPFYVPKSLSQRELELFKAEFERQRPGIEVILGSPL